MAITLDIEVVFLLKFQIPTASQTDQISERLTDPDLYNKMSASMRVHIIYFGCQFNTS